MGDSSKTVKEVLVQSSTGNHTVAILVTAKIHVCSVSGVSGLEFRDVRVAVQGSLPKSSAAIPV